MAISGTDKALMYALGGIMRGGASRGGYIGGNSFISVGGSQRRTSIALDTLTITDELDETANRCTFRIIDGTAATGQDVTITLGSLNNLDRLFAGHVIDVQESYGLKPANQRADVSCLDYTWQLGFVKVTKRYSSQSASTIAQDLIATYAAVNGFTAQHVAPDLPFLAEITYTNEDLTDALTRLARRIGAYWYVDYHKDVHLFYDEASNGQPHAILSNHPTLSRVVHQADRSQTLTRVYVEGRGSRVLGAVTAGDTLIPLDAVDMFAAVSDVFVKVSFQGADGGAQHLNFAGVVSGGGGTLVGPGALPAAAPTATVAAGSGVTTGSHEYAVTFTTAAGESLPSPRVSAVVGALPPAPVLSAVPFGAPPLSGTWQVKITWFVNGAETLASPASNPAVISASLPTLHITLPIGPAGTSKRRVYFKEPGAGAYRAWREQFDVMNNTLTESDWAAQMNGPLITEPTGTFNQVNLSDIPIGNASVTGRKVYRTAANAAPLQLLATIANNTATTHTDTAADAALGATAPAADASGLQQPPGQVAAGSTSMVIAGTSAFPGSGGWAIIGNGEQVIRYTGVTAGSLTGIPASGVGAITASIAYNSTITAAPMLTGIPASGPRSITRPLTAGDEIYLVVQVDDLARQTQLAAMGGNGIREEWDQDRRLSIEEARARGTALLVLRELDQARLSYTCRDLLTASGKTAYLDLFLGSSRLQGAFRIQRVTINNFRPYPNQLPTYTVEASSSRYSFEDLLRSAKTRE